MTWGLVVTKRFYGFAQPRATHAFYGVFFVDDCDSN
jgi:hypothetical protein